MERHIAGGFWRLLSDTWLIGLMQIRFRSFLPILAVVAAVGCAVLASSAAVMADGEIQPKKQKGARFRSHAVAPGGAATTSPAGTYDAGPCTWGSANAYRAGTDYLAGVDTLGNPVAPADVPVDPNAAYAGLEFYFDRRRPRTAQERRFGLRPRDFVTVDGSGKKVLYNGYPLIPAPQPIDPCEAQ